MDQCAFCRQSQIKFGFVLAFRPVCQPLNYCLLHTRVVCIYIRRGSEFALSSRLRNKLKHSTERQQASPLLGWCDGPMTAPPSTISKGPRQQFSTAQDGSPRVLFPFNCTETCEHTLAALSSDASFSTPLR